MGEFQKQRPFGRSRGKSISGGRGGSSRGFGGGRGGFSKGRGGFGGGDRQMHDAVCADCGNSCKVPFFPSGEKPVYCSNCFENHGNDAPHRSDRGGFNARPERRSFTPSFDRSERPARGERPPALHNEKLDIIIAKLDKVLKLLKPIMVESPEVAQEVSEIMAEVAPQEGKEVQAEKRRRSC